MRLILVSPTCLHIIPCTDIVLITRILYFVLLVLCKWRHIRPLYPCMQQKLQNLSTKAPKLHSRHIFIFFSDFTGVISMRYYICLVGSCQCRLFCLGVLWNWCHCPGCLCFTNKWLIDRLIEMSSAEPNPVQPIDTLKPTFKSAAVFGTRL